ncbi:glutamine amidotransferase, partial [Salmonella enterica subsp. enterica serovar Kentucky]|nr:glutamine amidotransferase [Salmonella enterica subsp. enterica serovar Kentucky]
YHLGCKGPETWGNCSTLQFCDVGGVWPVAIGHPCYGCNEEGICAEAVSPEHPVVNGFSDYPVFLGYNQAVARDDADVVLTI